MFFVNRHSVKNTLKVFYSTIQKLEEFDWNNNERLHLDSAQLFEIKRMNTVIQKMADTIRKDFELQKEYEDSEQCFKEALKLLKRTQSDKTLGYLYILKRLAYVSYLNDKFTESERYF